jgi:hypothetical protein
MARRNATAAGSRRNVTAVKANPKTTLSLKFLGTPWEHFFPETCFFLVNVDNVSEWEIGAKDEKKREPIAKFPPFFRNLFSLASGFQDRWFQPLTHPSDNYFS